MECRCNEETKASTLKLGNIELVNRQGLMIDIEDMIVLHKKDVLCKDACSKRRCIDMPNIIILF